MDYMTCLLRLPLFYSILSSGVQHSFYVVAFAISGILSLLILVSCCFQLSLYSNFIIYFKYTRVGQ